MSNKIKVYLASEEIFANSIFFQIDSGFDVAQAKAAFEAGQYDLVGEIEIPFEPISGEDWAEYAFGASQNFNEPWNSNPCRSSSVGDIFEKDGEKVIVSSSGFVYFARWRAGLTF